MNKLENKLETTLETLGHTIPFFFFYLDLGQNQKITHHPLYVLFT